MVVANGRADSAWVRLVSCVLRFFGPRKAQRGTAQCVVVCDKDDLMYAVRCGDPAPYVAHEARAVGQPHAYRVDGKRFLSLTGLAQLAGGANRGGLACCDEHARIAIKAGAVVLDTSGARIGFDSNGNLREVFS